MIRRALIAMTLVFAVAHAAAAAPQWAIDPADPGPDLPPTGRALFDTLAADGIPFPFEALLAKLDRQLACAKGERCVHGVLIPLGRSLQRTAASPDFFASPRVVVAVTEEGSGPLRAKDRLFIGYQQTSGLLEVISYNERAGRFEFQIVRDYRRDAKPRVVYAARAVCVACHQNQAPLFSRQVWDETNANPAVAAKLAAHGLLIHGIEVRRGVDFPNAIDDATDRANLFAVTRRIWRDACDDACRAGAAVAAERHRRSGGREFDDGAWRDALVRGFDRTWPDGLAIPNGDIPNRDPFLHAAGREGLPAVHVGAAFEALAPRAPLEVWRADDPTLARRFIAGLAADPGIVSPESEIKSKRLPLPRADETSLQAAPQIAVPFVAACAACHGTPETSPPNFLWGDAARVERNLRHCAPRIHARLSMWTVAANDRAKVPMPPPRASRNAQPWIGTAAPEGVAALRDAAAGWLRDESGGDPSRVDGYTYEQLRPCLAPSSTRLQ